MNKISDRLLEIARFINKGEFIADIGTDHGYLPLYLYEHGIISRALLTDLSRESLNKAVFNLQKYEGVFEYRLGSGLEILDYNEVDTVVIAGMGGNTIIDILEKDFLKTQSYDKIIFQPRTAMIELRKWLQANKIPILNESLAREANRISEIIVAGKQKKIDSKSSLIDSFELDEIDYEISPLLFGEDPLLRDFIENKIKKTMAIRNEIINHGRTDHHYKLKKIDDRIRILEQLLAEVKG